MATRIISRERYAELTAERDALLAAHDREYARQESRSMFDRIEEADASEDVKDILRRISEHLGILY